MTEPTNDPFASSESRPSVSFKDAPVGTTFKLTVEGLPSLVQARDFETGEPAEWPDGNKKMTVATDVVDTETGEQKTLWAAKPSALFAAINAAQTAARSTIAVGGTLVVTYTGDKPNEKNPRLNAAKQYSVQYTPPDAFGEAATTIGNLTVGPTQPAAPVVDPAAAAAAIAALTPEQKVALGIS